MCYSCLPLLPVNMRISSWCCLAFCLAFRDRARAAALEALVAILFRSSALRDLARALPPCRANSIRAFFKTCSSITQVLHLASKMARAHPAISELLILKRCERGQGRWGEGSERPFEMAVLLGRN